MGHQLSAIIGKAPINEDKVREYQLAVAYENGYAIVILDIYSLAYWVGKLNIDTKQVHQELPDADELSFFFAKELGWQTYAIIQTDYFAGIGEQHAMLFDKGRPLTDVLSINDVLRKLGVSAAEGKDEFDTLNLGEYRQSERYYWSANNLANDKINMIPGRIPENLS